jgi:hypothetical protein
LRSVNVQDASLPAQTFSDSGTPTLVIQGNAASINVHAGSSNSIVVQATKHISGIGTNLNDITENATQNDQTITVTTTTKEANAFMGGSEEVNLDIAVPATVNTQVKVQAGKLVVNGTSGQFTVNADAADVEMDNVTLKGQSQVIAQAGKISFTGTLDPQSNDLFKTQAGDIDLTLPDNAAFNLKTSVNFGKVSNEFGSNSVGSAPQAQLEIDTNAGNVAIHKR